MLDLQMPTVVIPATIIKRDGRVVEFDPTRIQNAILKCLKASRPIDTDHSVFQSWDLTNQVVNVVSARYHTPTVEKVQDTVEMVLQASGEYEAAKHYILYRAEHAKVRQERPIPAEVRRQFEQAAQYFPNPIQQFQFYDKYARYNYDLGRRETWIETVDRAVDYLHELAGDRVLRQDYEKIRSDILNMRAMPSMRLLAMAGPAARRQSLAIYNCSALPVDSLDSFVEALIISMAGCGVGYSVEQQFVEQLPRVKRQSTWGHQLVMSIDDSSEGWAEALRFGLNTWFDGQDVMFDYKAIRPAGAPLKIKGGRASGPEPLRVMFEKVRAKILARQGSFLRPIDAHDIMCLVGNAAVSGGVRRTAMISLFDFDDYEMRHAKDGNFDHENSQRWNANNSAVWPAGLTQLDVMEQMLVMMRSGRGEPGIFNRSAAQETRPLRRDNAQFLCNPCVTGDTWVLTDMGPRQVGDLADKHQTYVNGFPEPASGFWETGIKPVFVLKTKQGYNLRLTANHKVFARHFGETGVFDWLEAGQLKPGDSIKIHNHRGANWSGEGSESEGWLLGSLVGDGTFDSKTAILEYWGENRALMTKKAVGIIQDNLRARVDLQGHDQAEYNRTIIHSTGLRDLAAAYGIYKGMKTVTPLVEQSSFHFHRGFLQGLFDADGSVIGSQQKGVSVRLAQSDIQLLTAVQRMLLRLGVVSTIYSNRREAGTRLMPNGRGGYDEYNCRAQHELVVANDNLFQFSETVDFSDPEKHERLEGLLRGYKRHPNQEHFIVQVESISPDGDEMVYDCSVDSSQHAFDANGMVVHNCGEINLRPHGLCNLSIAVARPDDTYDTLSDKVKTATLIGTIQSLATNFPGLRDVWRRNAEDERLLGVDINGQYDSPISRDPDVQWQLQQEVRQHNAAYAVQLGINISAATTCVKPSGNSSQLLDCSSGIHPRWAPYYIRNVRVSTHTPIYKVLRDAGVPMDPENGQTPETAITWVVHFPVAAPKDAITRKSISAIEQCDYWLQVKENWTEHNPSVTITYQPGEEMAITQWVFDHQDKIGGMTFLPADDARYDQMPYQEISATDYVALATKFPPIDFSKLYYYELDDQSTAAQELACLAGSCEVDLTPR